LSIETPGTVAAAPHKNPYGKLIRERGTSRILGGAVLFALAWYIYSTIHISRMNQVHWPALQPNPAGLTVVGLRDQNRPGWKRKYVAVESNHAWRIRRPDDDSSDGADAGTAGGDSTDTKERGNDPGAVHKVARGEIVSVEELLKACPAVLVLSNFTDANVEERRENAPPPFDRTYWVVHLGMDDEGRSRFWQFSSEHEGERLAFILNGEIITCTKMENTPAPYLYMFQRSLDIQPIWVKADAQRLADFINRKTK
jgi:hypothetical protein